MRTTSRQAGRQASRQAGRQAASQAGKQAGRRAGGQANRPSRHRQGRGCAGSVSRTAQHCVVSDTARSPHRNKQVAASASA
jgi:hypothetical protein